MKNYIVASHFLFKKLGNEISETWLDKYVIMMFHLTCLTVLKQFY